MLRDERIQEIRSRIEACGPRHCEACKMLDEVLLSQAELKRENERLRSTLWCIRATTMEKEIANICNEALASPPSQADRTPGCRSCNGDPHHHCEIEPTADRTAKEAK